jgi:NAD-dependent dihydropyrimidine dehydrogenase PreA subunit
LLTWLLGLVLSVVLLTALLLLTLWIVGERGQFALPSTRAAFHARKGGYGPTLRVDGSPVRSLPTRGRIQTILNGLHGYVYSRWPEKYIGIFVKHLLPRASRDQRRRWADHYHGKVLPLDLAKSIITLDHDIPRTDLEQIIPYPLARDILLNASPEVTVLDCPCRMIRENPCLPLGVCMIVGGGAFVREHLPDRSRRVTRKEALDILEAEHERGHVHTAYFKDAVGDRFYAICNCCSCCCGGIEAMMQHGVPMVTSSGYVADVDPDLCIACGECVNSCPFGAVSLETDQAVVSWGDCMGCGVCESRCATGGMTLHLDPGKGIPLDVRVLGRPTVSA